LSFIARQVKTGIPMKTPPHRSTIIIVVLTLGCCALIVGLRALAQTGSGNLKLTLRIDGYAKLKSPYHENHDEFEKLLQQHGSAYYLVHHNDSGDRIHNKGTMAPSARAPQKVATSEIIPVQLTKTSPTATATAMPLKGVTGPSVTQQISTASTSDMQSVLSAFESP
jgi:hypothetical protein